MMNLVTNKNLLERSGKVKKKIFEILGHVILIKNRETSRTLI